jgi:hypothetical protein
MVGHTKRFRENGKLMSQNASYTRMKSALKPYDFSSTRKKRGGASRRSRQKKYGKTKKNKSFFHRYFF